MYFINHSKTLPEKIYNKDISSEMFNAQEMLIMKHTAYDPIFQLPFTWEGKFIVHFTWLLRIN